jgi:hypothetical protein
MRSDADLEWLEAQTAWIFSEDKDDDAAFERLMDAEADAIGGGR